MFDNYGIEIAGIFKKAIPIQRLPNCTAPFYV